MKFTNRDIYKKEGVTKEWLRENGFRRNRNYNDSTEDIYTMRFPLHKYKKTTTLEGELLIDYANGSVIVNAYMPNTNEPYPPFYYMPYGVYDPLMKEIENNINKKFKELGIIITKRKDKKNAQSSKI